MHAINANNVSLCTFCHLHYSVKFYTCKLMSTANNFILINAFKANPSKSGIILHQDAKVNEVNEIYQY